MTERVVTVADSAVEVVTFSKPDGAVEIVLTATLQKQPTRILVPARKGMRIVTTRYPTGEVEIVYEED